MGENNFSCRLKLSYFKDQILYILLNLLRGEHSFFVMITFYNLKNDRKLKINRSISSFNAIFL